MKPKTDRKKLLKTPDEFVEFKITQDLIETFLVSYMIGLLLPTILFFSTTGISCSYSCINRILQEEVEHYESFGRNLPNLEVSIVLRNDFLAAYYESSSIVRYAKIVKQMPKDKVRGITRHEVCHVYLYEVCHINVSEMPEVIEEAFCQAYARETLGDFIPLNELPPYYVMLYNTKIDTLECGFKTCDPMTCLKNDGYIT